MASLTGLFRVCKTAVLRYTPNRNEPVTNLLLAYDWGSKGDGGKRPTQFVDADLWGKRAEDLTQYLKQGCEITCTIDDPRIEMYTRRDGTRASKLVGRVNQIEFGGKRPASNSDGEVPA